MKLLLQNVLLCHNATLCSVDTKEAFINVGWDSVMCSWIFNNQILEDKMALTYSYFLFPWSIYLYYGHFHAIVCYQPAHKISENEIAAASLMLAAAYHCNTPLACVWHIVEH